MKKKTDDHLHLAELLRWCLVSSSSLGRKKLAEHGCKVYILGGEFKAVTEAIVGEEAVFTLDKYNFTERLLGSQWCQPAEGIFHTGS